MVIHKRPGDTSKFVFFKIHSELREKKEFQDVGTEDMIIGITDRGDLEVLVGSDDSGFGSHGSPPEVLLRKCFGY
jgi:hypothetical protein